MPEESVILFDANCGLCNRVMRMVKRSDKEGLFKFVPLESEDAAPFLKKENLSPNQLSTMVFCAGEKCFIKSDAALEVARRLGGLWRLTVILLAVPKSIRDTIYDFIAQNRHRFCCQNQLCLVPKPERLP